MKALVIYFSKFGNTRSIAEEVGEILHRRVSIEVISSDKLHYRDLEGVDLVFMGTPTHHMNLPKAVKPVLAGLPKRSLRGVRFVAFDTSYKLSWGLTPFTAGQRLDAKLQKAGGKRIAPPMIFHVEERGGPLYPGELERAIIWAEEIGISLNIS